MTDSIKPLHNTAVGVWKPNLLYRSNKDRDTGTERDTEYQTLIMRYYILSQSIV